jgi:hypothetical protein
LKLQTELVFLLKHFFPPSHHIIPPRISLSCFYAPPSYRRVTPLFKTLWTIVDRRIGEGWCC